MSNFIELLQNEIISTIEGLTGIPPEVELQNELEIDDKTTIPRYCTFKSKVGGDLDTIMEVSVVLVLVQALSGYDVRRQGCKRGFGSPGI